MAQLRTVEELQNLVAANPNDVLLQTELRFAEAMAEGISAADNRKTLMELVQRPWPTVAAPSESFPGRRSRSKTRPRHSRTFTEVVPWEGWEASLNALRARLPETDKIFNTELPGRAGKAFPHATKEGVLEAAFMSQAELVNDLAEEMGYKVRYKWGGSSMSKSQCDLLIRMKDEFLQPYHVNFIDGVMGDIETKGEWQVDLDSIADLPAYLQEYENAKKVAPALQQCFGDSILDSSPVMMITIYSTTFALRRVPNSKQLQCSPPIRIAGEPSLALLYVLEYLTDLVGNGKAAMMDENVAATPPQGHPAPRPPARGRGRGQRGGRGGQVPGSFSYRAGRAGGVRQLSADLVKRAMEVLSWTKDIQVLKSSFNEQQVAVKMFRPESEEARKEFSHEFAVYQTLSHLQGHAIPRFIAAGELEHSETLVIVTEFYEQGDIISAFNKERLRANLASIHGANYIHGDMHRANLLVGTNCALFCDFVQAKSTNDTELMECERLALEEILR